MKPNELTGTALDWAVAKCEGAFDLRQRTQWHNKPWQCSFRDEEEPEIVYHCYLNELEYSTDWAQGGPIIEREKIDILCMPPDQYTRKSYWVAKFPLPDTHNAPWLVGYGPTPLIAGMRCYVASKLGDDIEIPKEMTLKFQRS